MKRLMKMIEDIMVSVTFAEAGEFETARELVAKTNEDVAEEAAVLHAMKTA